MSSLEEVALPYICRQVVILHNPIETGDKHMRGLRPGFCKSTYWNMLPKDSIYCCQLYRPLVVSIWVFFISREWPYHGITYLRKYRRGRYIR
jgi:hypothetical protein